MEEYGCEKFNLAESTIIYWSQRKDFYENINYPRKTITLHKGKKEFI